MALIIPPNGEQTSAKNPRLYIYMRGWIVGVSVVFLFLSGCAERACTEIGCVDGLVINFDLEEGTLAEVTLKSANQEDFMECGGIQSDCPSLEVFDAFIVSEISVELYQDSSLISSYTQAVTYETNRPNGPGCDPECKQASVTISD